MSERDEFVYVQHMLDAASKAIALSGKISRPQFTHDSVEALAITRLLEIVGEAARRTSPEFRTRFPTIEWKQIAGTRDRLIHGYDVIDLDMIWEICKSDLPALVPRLKKVLEGHTFDV
jgi:uncharacterized protein with HEPN domain